ncbi:hypothetical protein ACJX0J_018383 [Zea mays]
MKKKNLYTASGERLFINNNGRKKKYISLSDISNFGKNLYILKVLMPGLRHIVILFQISFTLLVWQIINENTEELTVLAMVAEKYGAVGVSLQLNNHLLHVKKYDSRDLSMYTIILTNNLGPHDRLNHQIQNLRDPFFMMMNCPR